MSAITGIRNLIDLKGKIVTTDSLHCNRRMVAKIIDKGGDYCLSLKGNQESLLSDARACFSKIGDAHPTAKNETAEHGRIETRVATVVEPTVSATITSFPD